MAVHDPEQPADPDGGARGESLGAASGPGGDEPTEEGGATRSHVPRRNRSNEPQKPAESGASLPEIPGYVIEHELGRGGMGVVYRARQVDLNRIVAVKMILGGRYTDRMARARFLIEAEIIAAIRHPNVVQVYEFGRHDDQPYFVLEYVDGGSLAAQLKANGRFAPGDAARMVAKLADGMVAAHQKGVVHRDLKPANVLLTEAGEPKITDFGLARMGESAMTMTGDVMGTPSYMSPEQAAGKIREIGTPTDVYALGVILHELCAGRPPFRGESALDTVHQVLTREPDHLRALDRRLPRDLETICLKCLEKDPARRYATANELATDLRAFLELRPIAARPVGALERMAKWARRNPAGSAGIAATLLLAAGATAAGLAIREQVIKRQNEIIARGLVLRLLDANTADVPDIVKDIGPYRGWADPLLRSALSAAEARKEPRKQLHASLALLPVDRAQAAYLADRLLDAQPHELQVVIDGLAPHERAFHERFWAVAESPAAGNERQRLRAAAALARYDAQSDRWPKVSGALVDDLVRENPVFLGQWSEAFRPVRQRLVEPLRAVFADRSPEHGAERMVATNLLADYASGDARVIAGLLMDADIRQFAIIYPKFRDLGARGSPPLTAVLDTSLPAALPSADPERERLAQRQANAAVALLRLDRPKHVWPLLRHGPDPRVRSYLIHRLAPLGGTAEAVAQRLNEESDLSARRALLLALGEFSEQRIPPATAATLREKVLEIYRTDRDPGLHAACEWLLRQWRQATRVDQMNDGWARDEQGRRRRMDAIRRMLADRGAPAAPQWFVNTQGQTLIVIPGPVEFLMGSPAAEKSRQERERQHRRRIGRSFAIAAKAVTLEQYRRLTKDKYEYAAVYRRDPTLPVVWTDWYMAANYCNLLSKEEGFPEDQWCYKITPDTIEMRANYLSLAGYRLPTEAEMEYATRAGAVTSRYYGETEELLRHYGWYRDNSNDVPQPVGRKKPNDLGLFDALGNSATWCQDVFAEYPTTRGDEWVDDREGELAVTNTSNRIVRGGTHNQSPSNLRSSVRLFLAPLNKNNAYGLRVARTIVP
jgi:formylglycine-generating enzyme required for sulfatase activity